MELSPFRNQRRFYRNRSASFPTPNSRNFLYQEIYTEGENTPIRSFTCDQYFRKGKNGEAFASTRLHMTNFMSPVKNNKRRVKNGVGYERAREKLSIKCTDCDNIYEVQKDKEWDKMWILLCVLSNIFTLLFACYFFAHRYCNTEWGTENVSKILKHSVFGQDEAMRNVMILLNKFSKNEESMVVSFVGGIGVGKTMVANIIQDNFPWGMNKHLHFFDSNTEEILFHKKYSFCGSNLIIVDDMNVNNLGNALNIIQKTSSFSAKFLLILIFQNGNQSDIHNIVNGLNSCDIQIETIVFEYLSAEDVKKCFEVELKKQRKILPETELNKIVNEQMKFCNVSQSCVGCKNVFHEISRLKDDNYGSGF